MFSISSTMVFDCPSVKEAQTLLFFNHLDESFQNYIHFV